MNFKAAANQLNISPSALSRRIQKLEQQIGMRLLDRTTRHVKLTLAGKQFLVRAQEILTNVDELVLSLKGETASRMSTVTIAIIPSIAHRILPAALHRFHERYPTTRVTIKDMTTNEVDADFGITSFVQHDTSLEFNALLRGDVMAVAPLNHALARRRRVRWSELAHHVVIATWKGAGIRMVMDVDLAKARDRLVPFFEVQQMYTALKFVEAGLGVAPIPAFFLGPREHAELSIAPLIDPVISVDLGTIVSRNHPLRPQVREMLVTLADTCKVQEQLTRIRRN